MYSPERLYDFIIKSGAEVTTHQDSLEKSFTFKESQLEVFSKSLLHSHNESLKGKVENLIGFPSEKDKNYQTGFNECRKAVISLLTNA